MGSSTQDDDSERVKFSKYDSSVFMQINTKDGDGIMSGGFAKVSENGEKLMAYKFAGTDQND